MDSTFLTHIDQGSFLISHVIINADPLLENLGVLKLPLSAGNSIDEVAISFRVKFHMGCGLVFWLRYKIFKLRWDNI